MWSKTSLRTRIYSVLSFLVICTFIGGVVMIWYTYRIDTLLARIIDQDINMLEAAEELEIDLVAQKGFVSYYFIDRNPEWLNMLEERRKTFCGQVETASKIVTSGKPKRILLEIESTYADYSESMNRVIRYYKIGEREEGARLHETLRPDFSRILGLCIDLTDHFRERIQEAKQNSAEQSKKLRGITVAGLLFVMLFGMWLAFILVHDILEPVKRLVWETDRDMHNNRPGDEVKALKMGIHGLMEEYDHAFSELEKSREFVFQSEKMVMVGKLAAETAHSIRNPLTSVKMRLFSLKRSLALNRLQEEDFDVISEEIGHIDNILQNFLEFSRPPKLNFQRISPSDIVDQAALLLRHRLESCNARLSVERKGRLPEIEVDPEQLKEAVVNIVVNACETGIQSLFITIQEEEVRGKDGNRAIIRIRDNGPGVPEKIRETIFEPFFTTKDEGSGLGLSIVARIIQEHRGSVRVDSQEQKGTTFIIELPVPGKRKNR